MTRPKVDAQGLPREAQDEMRRQAMRMREELKLPWKDTARVVATSGRCLVSPYAAEDLLGLESKTRGRRYLSGRTLIQVQE